MKRLFEDEVNVNNENDTKNNDRGITEIVMILDRSGSMGGLESDTIGGFNSFIDKQKKEEGEAFVSVVLFDVEVIAHRAQTLEQEERTPGRCSRKGILRCHLARPSQLSLAAASRRMGAPALATAP